MLIVIRGTTCSGKTSIAKQVSQITGCQFIEPEMYFGEQKYSLKLYLDIVWSEIIDQLNKEENNIIVSLNFLSDGELDKFLNKTNHDKIKVYIIYNSVKSFYRNSANIANNALAKISYAISKYLEQTRFQAGTIINNNMTTEDSARKILADAEIMDLKSLMAQR